MASNAFTTFVINLDASRDRLAHMRAELAAAALDFERVPGISGDAVPPELRPYFFDREERQASRLKLGEIGCHAAHLSVCRRIVHDGVAVSLVLEDDARLEDRFGDLVARLLQALPAGWDVVRLSSPPKRAYVPLRRLGERHDLVRYSTVPNIAAGYLISLAGARKMLQPGLRTHSLDEFMRRPWLNGLDTYGVVPAVVAQAGLRSNIDAAETRVPARKENVVRKNLRKFDAANFGRRLAHNVRTLGPSTWCVCLALNASDRIAKRVLGKSQIHVFARWLAR